MPLIPFSLLQSVIIICTLSEFKKAAEVQIHERDLSVIKYLERAGYSGSKNCPSYYDTRFSIFSMFNISVAGCARNSSPKRHPPHRFCFLFVMSAG